jgi:hypothetical protein
VAQIHILRSNVAHPLLEFFEPDQLQRAYGGASGDTLTSVASVTARAGPAGTCDFEFDPSVYLGPGAAAAAAALIAVGRGTAVPAGADAPAEGEGEEDER